MAEAAARAPVPPALATEQPQEDVLDHGLTLLASLGIPAASASRPASLPQVPHALPTSYN
jgi:hypothetical protein